MRSDGHLYNPGADRSAAPAATVTHLTAPLVAASCSARNLFFAADGTVYQNERGSRSFLGGPTTRIYTVPGLTAPIIGVAADLATGGYWLVGRDGHVYGLDAPCTAPSSPTPRKTPS